MGYQPTRVPYALAYGGWARSDTSPGSLQGGWAALTTKRPWWPWGQHAISMPVRRLITVAADARGPTGGAGGANRRRHAVSFEVRQRLPTTP